MTDLRMIELVIEKAEKGVCSLEKFHHAFQGKLSKTRSATATAQAQFKWKITGAAAVEVCNKLWPYTELKQKQVKLAATFPEIGGSKAVMGSRDGIERVFTSITSCAETLGIVRHRMYVMFTKAAGAEFIVDGWTLQLVPKDSPAIHRVREVIAQKVAACKHTPHDPISRELPPAYIAGFADAEASIGVRQANGILIEIPQNYPAILNFLQSRYFGTVMQRPIDWKWGIYNIEDSRRFLQDVFPFLVEKRQQAELVLNMERNGAQALKHILRSLKGNQGTYHYRPANLKQ